MIHTDDVYERIYFVCVRVFVFFFFNQGCAATLSTEMHETVVTRSGDL